MNKFPLCCSKNSVMWCKCRALSTMDILMSFKRRCQGYVPTDVLSENLLSSLDCYHKLRTPKIRNRTVRGTNTWKEQWKRVIVKNRKKATVPLWFKHSMSIAHQLIPIYNTTVHKKRVMLPLMWPTVGAIRQQHTTRAVWSMSLV